MCHVILEFASGKLVTPNDSGNENRVLYIFLDYVILYLQSGHELPSHIWDASAVEKNRDYMPARALNRLDISLDAPNIG